MAQLSTGVLEKLLYNQGVAWPVHMQLLEVKTVTPKNNTSARRYKILVNDGKHTTNLMIATQMAEAIETSPSQYVHGAILSFSEIIANDVNGRKVMIALGFQVVGQAPLIGNPTPLPDQGAPVGNGAAAGAPGVPPQDQNVPPQNGQQAPPYGVPMKPDPHPPAQASGPPSGYGVAGQYGQNPSGVGPQQYGAPHNTGGQYGAPPSNPYGAAPAGPYGAQASGPYGAQPSGGYGAPPTGGPGGWGNPGPGPGPARPGMGGPGGPMSGGGGMGPQGSFLGRTPAPQYNMNSGGPVARNEAAARIVPIRSLNPYSGRWTIKGRCTSKGEMRRFNNARGDGRLFSFDLLDKDGGEIRATAFGEQADKFYEVVQLGKVFLVCKGSLQQKKPEFNHTNHQFEIRLERESTVDLCPEDQETQAIPDVVYNFVPIANLETIDLKSYVDVIGVVEQVQEWVQLTRKTGEEIRKRTVIIRDDSNRSVEITFWGDFVDDPGNQLEQMFKSGQRPVVAVKSARLGDYNGRNLSTIGGTVVKVDPPHEKTQALHQWYAQGGSTVPATSLSNAGGGVGRNDRRCVISAIKDENLGRQGKPEYVQVMGTVHILGNSKERGLTYPSCNADNNARKCQKKMVQDMEGASTYSCPLCGPGQPVWRYMLSLALADCTKSEWLTAFSNTADMLFGMPAEEYRRRDETDATFAERMADHVRWSTLVCRIKASEDTYNDEQRTRLTVLGVEHFNPVKESYMLLEGISKMEQGLPVWTARDVPGQQPAQGAHGGGGGYGGAGPGQSGAPGWAGNNYNQSSGGYGGGGGGAYGGGGGMGGPGGYAPSNTQGMQGGGYGQQQPPRGGYQGGPPGQQQYGYNQGGAVQGGAPAGIPGGYGGGGGGGGGGNWNAGGAGGGGGAGAAAGTGGGFMPPGGQQMQQQYQGRGPQGGAPTNMGNPMW